jgi:DNA-binding response OmpR family regulator
MDISEHLVLNVDDDEAARYSKSRILQHAGFKVIEAATGYDALLKTEEQQPSVVMLDVKLPDISGLEVCTHIKQRWPNIFVLQTSATYVTGADRTRGLEGGADAYLIQPIDPGELVAATRALIRLRATEDKLRRLNDTLEQRVITRTHDLAEANAKLKEEINQRKRAEAALVQAQKMEAIGHLTGGIAHDFNNLLTAVIGNIDRIRSRATDAKLIRLAENAFMAAERGSKLTAQLLAFSRTQKLVTQPVDVNTLIAGMSDLLNQSLGPAIELKIELQPDISAAVSDPNQLELAILNLAINSRDAMPSGRGEIQIRTMQGFVGDHDDAREGGDYVTIAVTDNGSGMSSEVLARAFDPFFTTKPAGKGTGLGLSQVYGIARQAGGSVQITSELGKGTTVAIRLCVSPEAAISAVPASEPTDRRNSEIILVVDDDADVRSLVDEFLSEIGYRTHVADSGEAAFRMLDEVTPDLLLADFAMPGANGAEVARSFRQRLPDVPILFFSGYADTAALEAAVGKAPLLRKPFRPSELAAAIRTLLDRSARH